MHVARWFKSLFRTRLQVGFGAFGFAALITVGFLPLVGGPGYESALATGLLLPALVACATAIDTARRRPTPLDGYRDGLGRGAAYALLAILITLAHGVRAGFCDPLADTALLVLGGAFGTVVAGGWGSAAGLVAARLSRRRTLAAVLLALAGPLGGIAVSLARFYTSPMVFAYDPFFGLFAGPLYDTVVDHLDGLLTYRLGSSLTLIAAGVTAYHLRLDPRGRLRIAAQRHPGLRVVGAAAALGSILLTWYGPELGHYQTTRTIRQALGQQSWSGRCHVVFSSSVRRRDAQLIADQCDVHLRRLATYFDTPGPERCTVYLFASAQEKSHLMGAGRTHIAKPWREEIYIQGTGYPHPVLRHELAHVVAGTFGRGPFRVSGPLGGWVPDPGRIEGVAEAAAPHFDADLTPQQWARALQELELLPSLDAIFRLTFLGENSSTAYTVAGAFVEWFRARYGAKPLRDWYAGAPFSTVTGGRSLGQVETDWQQSLAAVPLPPSALAAARARFDRPPIFGRACPRVVDGMADQAAALLSRGDPDAARHGYQALLHLDPGHTRARLALGKCARIGGDLRRARDAFRQVAQDPAVPDLHQAQARELVADLDLAAGDLARARRGYQRVHSELVDEDHLRTLDLKLSVSGDMARRAVIALLIGAPERDPNWATAAPVLGEWAASEPRDGTANYLIGRNLWNQGYWTEAAAHLDEALRRSIPSLRLRREAARLRAVVACARGNLPRARNALARYLAEPRDTEARRAGMEHFAALCGIAGR